MIDKIVEKYPDLFYSTGNTKDGSQRMFFKDKFVCECELKISTYNGKKLFNIYTDSYYLGLKEPNSVSLIISNFKDGVVQFFDYKPLEDEILLRFYKYGIIFQYFTNAYKKPIKYDILSVIRRAAIKNIID